MKYISHLTSACAVAVAVPFIFNGFDIPLSTSDMLIGQTSIIAGGLFSDCDTASKPSRLYALLLAVIAPLFIFFGVSLGYFMVITYPFLLAKIWPHRSWTHSPILPPVVSLSPFILFYLVGLGLGLKDESLYKLSIIAENYEIAFFGFALGVAVHIIIDTKIVKKLVRFIGGEKLIAKLY